MVTVGGGEGLRGLRHSRQVVQMCVCVCIVVCAFAPRAATAPASLTSDLWVSN